MRHTVTEALEISGIDRRGGCRTGAVQKHFAKALNILILADQLSHILELSWDIQTSTRHTRSATISGGANIYPAEIEAALEEHPSVLSAVALGLPSEDLGQYVHAIVQRRDGCELGRNELSSFLSQRLAKYKIPRAFEFVTHALRDEAGKVRRSALRAEREGRGGASLGGTAA